MAYRSSTSVHSRNRNVACFDFLHLPAELRTLVYHFYFVNADGYLYNPDTGCLTCADGGRIDLSVILTCRLVANETRHWPLQCNPIIFRTGGPKIRQQLLPPEDLWTHRAIHWDFDESDRSWDYSDKSSDLAATMQHLPVGALVQYREFITPDVAKLAISKYPNVRFILDHAIDSTQDLPIYKRVRYIFRNGEAPSLVAAFKECVMETAAQLHPDARCLDHWRVRHRLQASIPSIETQQEVFELHDNHPDADNGPIWLLPTVCSAISRRFADSKPPPRFEPPICSIRHRSVIGERSIWADNSQFEFPVYSAAALAISFLQSLSKGTRLTIRHLVLQERQQSYACPSRHGQGLIPFCQENHRLTIERYVDVKEILHSRTAEDTKSKACGPCSISSIIALWLVEADALFTLGMPEGSFRFIFDGGVNPSISSSIFQQVVQRDCAWQIAYEAAFDESHPPSSNPLMTYWKKQRNNCFIYKDFPRVMNRLLDPDDMAISCNFDPGYPWDASQLPAQHPYWNLECWNRYWRRRPEFKGADCQLNFSNGLHFTTEVSYKNEPFDYDDEMMW